MLKARLPFEGFYQGAIASYIEERCSELIEDPDNVNWKQAYLEMAEAYAEVYARTLPHGENYQFRELWSPRAYNYATDEITVALSEATIREIYTSIDKGTLSKTIREKFRPRPGFSPYYDWDIAEWPKSVLDWDELELMVLLQAYAVDNKAEFDLEAWCERIDEILLSAQVE